MATVAVLIGTEPAERHSVHRAYADAVWAVGATPMLLPAPPPTGLDRFIAAALRADAIMLTGGGDVEPMRYGEGPVPAVAQVDAERDAAEIAVVGVARTAGLPILGICRGAQVLAVAAGGRLHQHLPDAGHHGHWEEVRQYEPVHRVRAEPGTLAEQILGSEEWVNSIHHQGIATSGDLRATAWSEDGLIEAVEDDGVLGVQWHPERLFAGSGGSLEAFRWLAGCGVRA